MAQRFTLPAVALLSAAVGAGAIVAARTIVPGERATACRGTAATLARLELLFGLGRKDGGTIGEGEWQAFVDAEVTPRFPDGLTVLSGYGQWQGAAGAVSKEGAKVLLIWYRPAPDAEARIEAIRRAYKLRFGQESVLRADGASCVSF